MSDVRSKLCVVCAKVYRAEQMICPDDGTVLVLEAAGGERPARLGHVLGNYRLLRVLGEGGVGTVYEAEHIRLGRKMAIKLLHPDAVTTEGVTRLFNEARAVNETRHANIIEVEDFVTTAAGEHYMLMELLEGEDLRAVISREGTLAPERVTAIGEQLASALAAVHAVQIVHRDLKPDNIFVVQRDGRETFKLLDFGAVKFTNSQHGVTRAGMTMGTPTYMAPEMIISGREQEVGVGADLYALGMVMYEALTGQPAFTGTQLAAILRAHCFEPVVPPSQKSAAPIPPVLEAAVLKCLEKSVENRFITATELGAALRASQPVRLSGQVSVARAATRVTRPAPRRSVLTLMLPAFAMAAAAIALQVLPRGEDEAAAAGPRVVPAPIAGSPRPAPSRPATIALALASTPAGAELYLGAGRTPLGIAPITTNLLFSSEPVEIVARFADGTEVRESVVPDRPHPELIFAKPPTAVAPIAIPKRRTVAQQRVAAPLPDPPAASAGGIDERDATLDPFKR